MARRNVINNSDDDADADRTLRPSPPVVKKAAKATPPADLSDAEGTEIEDDEEATTSMDEFIDDRAIDDLSEHSASAEEGFTDHEADRRHITPPLKQIDAPKFPSDTDDEGVDEAEDFQADVVESPRKRLVKRDAIQDESDDEDDSMAMDISPIQKKQPKKKPSETVVHLVEDSDSDEVTIVGHKKATAKKTTNVRATKPMSSVPAKSTPAKKTPKKKPISQETLSDTDDDAIVALKLAKDDKMYPETKSVKVQASNLKRGLPITPPLATRSSSKKQRKGPAGDEDEVATLRPLNLKASSKKGAPRNTATENTEDDDDEHDAPVRATTKKAVAARKAPALKVPDEEDVDDAPAKASPKKAAARKTASQNVEEDDVDDVVPVKASTKKTGPARKAPVRKVQDEDEDDDAPAKASPRKAAARKTAAQNVDQEEDEEDAPVKASTKKTGPARKAPVRKVQEEEDDVDAPAKASPKKAAARKTAAQNVDEEEDEEEVPVKASTKKASARKAPPRNVEDEEDDGNAPAKASPRKTAARKTAVDEDEDEAAVKASSKKAGSRKSATRKANAKEDDVDAPAKASPKKTAARKIATQNVDEEEDEEEGRVITSKKTMAHKATFRKDAVDNGEKEAVSAPIDNDDVFGKRHAKGASDDKIPELNTHAAFAAALAKIPKKSSEAPASEVFEPKPEYGSITQRYSSKVWRALAPPDSCEVYDANLCDEYLSSVKSYVGMPKLRACVFENTGTRFSGIETGCIFIGMWKDILPNATFQATVDLIAFTSDGRFVNLSRIAPSRIYARAMSETRHESAIDGKTAIAVSVVCVRESGLVRDLVPTYPYKGIRGVPATNEGQRIPATLGEVARRTTLHTQIWNSAITFNTKVQATGRSGKVVDLPSAFYNTYQSPKKPRSVNASSLPDHVGALEYDDRIPVYDARNVRPGFKFDATVFANPADHFALLNFSEFPEYNGEIPPNSLCVVGYVTQFYRMPDSAGGKDANGKGKGKAAEEVEPQELRVNMFIRWILLLGVIN